MTNIEIPKEITFDLPEGKYRARITGVKPVIKQTGKGAQDWVRILFDVSVPGMEALECRAGRQFLKSFKQGSDLRNFLTPLLGADFFKKNSGKIKDLDAVVINKEGVAEIVHFQGQGYPKPLVIVNRIDPIAPEEDGGGKD